MKHASNLLLAIASLATATPGHAGEPQYFRSSGGVAEVTQALPNNLDDDARQVWRADLLPGNSTPCVYDNFIFLTIWDETATQLSTVALERKTGDVIWKRTVPTDQIEPFHQVGSPASCTPACNGRQLFVFFGSYGLLCYDLKGNLLWEHRMGPFQDEFGASSSPILVDDLVVLNEDHDVGSYLIAIDQKTGKSVWKTSREEVARSYSTPVVWENQGRKQIIVAGSLQLTAYDASNGKKLWWVNGLSRIVDPTPVISDGLIYMATWTPGGDPAERISMEPFPQALTSYDRNGDSQIEVPELPDDSPVVPRFFRIDLNQDGKLDQEEWNRHATVFARAQNVAIAITPGGSGDVTETNVRWIHRRGLPTVPSSVVYEGIMYMVKDSGIVTSLDAKNGEVLKRGRARGAGNYYASLTAADGKIYLASERGVITILKAGRDWRILGTRDLGERIMATPVVSAGQIFIRTDEGLYCFEKA